MSFRRTVALTIGGLALLLVLGACSDNLTDLTPLTPETEVLRAPSVSPLPGEEECDPYLSLDWCEEVPDPCTESIGSTPGDATVQGCEGTGGGGGGGTGEETTPPPEHTDPICDPEVDPTCEQPLTGPDSLSIKKAMADHVRRQAAFTDEVHAKFCKEMVDEFWRKFHADEVFRGAYDTPDDDTHVGAHFGAWDPATGHIHFDPAYLEVLQMGGADAADYRELANTALHEAAHARGYNHSTPVGGYYVEPPFSYLSPGSNSCLTWSS